MSGSEEQIFCHYEGRRFDSKDFLESDEHGLVHKRRPFHTTDGALVPALEGRQEPELPAPAEAPPDAPGN